MDEVRAKLKMKSTDAAVRWCLVNNVARLKSSNKNVVVEYEFRLAFEKPIIAHLIEKYGEKWREYYDAYDSENVLNFYALEQIPERDKTEMGVFNPDNFLKLVEYGKS